MRILYANRQVPNNIYANAFDGRPIFFATFYRDRSIGTFLSRAEQKTSK